MRSPGAVRPADICLRHICSLFSRRPPAMGTPSLFSGPWPEVTRIGADIGARTGARIGGRIKTRQPERPYQAAHRAYTPARNSPTPYKACLFLPPPHPYGFHPLPLSFSHLSFVTLFFRHFFVPSSITSFTPPPCIYTGPRSRSAHHSEPRLTHRPYPISCRVTSSPAAVQRVTPIRVTRRKRLTEKMARWLGFGPASSYR